MKTKRRLSLTALVLFCVCLIMAYFCFVSDNFDAQAAQDPPVYINEICAKNTTITTGGEGKYYDWVELYNDSDTAVDLT
ncbi:MAG: hypothetical protein IK071_04215, partial [Lachnospiraceae bacterium]|nr:hypothetical protein [Lachnospiraceae bacterium]